MRRTSLYFEADIWAVFNCLALGVAGMNLGTEDQDKPAWKKDTELCHYGYVIRIFSHMSVRV